MLLLGIHGYLDELVNVVGANYENDTFAINMHNYNDCVCGFDTRLDQWRIDHDGHDANCMSSVFDSDDWFYDELSCTCDYFDDFVEFVSEYSHDIDCPASLPSFLYKDGDYRVWVVDNIAVCNLAVHEDELEHYITNCIKSITQGALNGW